MNIPRLRRLSDTIKEIKACDPETALTDYALRCMIHDNKIQLFKFGNSWLVNLDELYMNFTSDKIEAQETTIANTEGQRRMRTSGFIARMFQEVDPGTIIRKPNLRHFAKDNGIFHVIMPSKKWLVDLDGFMAAINPKQIGIRAELPRLRGIHASVKMFNNTHPEYRIDKHTIERMLTINSFFNIHHGNRWIINYDELVQEIEKMLRVKNSDNADIAVDCN